jgi:hypothetical protein
MIEEAIENGYMMREDVYKGNLKAGCIYYIEEAPEFKKCFRLPEPQYTEARYTEGQEALISTSSNKYDKNISPIVPKGDPPVFSKSRKVKEEKVEVAPNVFLTETQRLNLLERLKNNSEKLSACYDKLSVWKVGKGTTNINDYLNILRWVIKAVEEEASKPKPLDQEALNRDLASKVSEKYEYHKDIVFGYDYIEFKFGYNNFPHIKFRDFGFREQVINNLHKLGLRTEGL